jgi:PAS domain S-box-containing protein
MYLDMAGVILLALDRKGKIILANPKTCSVLAGEERDILGKDWFDNFIPEEDNEAVRGVFQQLMRGIVEPVEYIENRVKTLKGDVRWVAWHNTLIKSSEGEILGTFSSGDDISERRKAEQALRESEERFRELTDALPHVIFEVDIRQGLNTLQMIAEQDHALAAGNIERVLRGETPESTEYLACRKDGSTFPVMIHSTRIEEEGRATGLRGIIVDLSEHKAAKKPSETVRRGCFHKTRWTRKPWSRSARSANPRKGRLL